jgi:unsaturated chondroitin disaccharide hydrolase
VHIFGEVRRQPTGVALVAAALILAAPTLGLLPAPPATAMPAPRVTLRNEPALDVVLRAARSFDVRQVGRTDRRLRAGRFPTVAVGDLPWRTSGTNGWLAGFWPGRLWQAYQLTGDPHWARRAAAREAPLVVRAGDTTTHDLGFLLQTSFSAGADITGSPSDRAVALRAARTLSGRFVPSVGALRSWDGPPGETTVIVDSLMNDDLLFWGADHGGPAEWRTMARQHALTVARWHLRPDGSTFHVVRFDDQTGQPVWRGTAQGLSDDSTWARGQSWAVAGFTAAYGETRDPALLEAARRAAGWTLAHLPADGVPWWDYDAPGTQRDTTAAAILASGLLDLARLDPDPEHRATWRAGGLHTLRSLVSPRYLARGTGGWSVLLHGHHDATYPDDGVTYGDYYLGQSLLRLQLLPSTRRALPVRTSTRSAGAMRVDLGRVRDVGAVSVRWRYGDSAATRFRVQTSRDGRTWRTVRSAVSSGAVATAETYDFADRPTRFVRVRSLGTSTGAPGGVVHLVPRA